MKYIIDIEDEPMIANSFHQEVDELWKAKGFNSLVFDKCGLNKLTPYTEPDRKAIEDEVWENTWKMFLTPEDFGATMGDSYSEAKAKYDVWKKEKDDVVKQKVVDLAEEIGIHRLYAIIREIRGE